MGASESKTRQKPNRYSSKLADLPTSPGKPQLVPSDIHSAEPDVVTIRWEPPLYDGGSRITGYLVEHRRTGSPHWVRSWPSLVRRPELTLSGLEPGWRYQFRVSAQNTVGLSEPGELSDLLTVTLQRTAASAPFFIKELQDTAALENEKAELSVQVRGTPTPSLSWFKDGVEVFSSRSYRIVTDNETSTLIIHQAALSDEGEVKCSATNRVGYTVTRAKLIIEAPPSIRLPRQYEEGLLFEKDEVIRLKVSVAGSPVPVVTWLLNGEPVPGGGRYEASHAERYATLRVGEARRSDRGEYTVRAVNKLGEDVANFLVTVADRPMPPNRAKVVMTLGRSVTLSWTAPEDDGGCKIGNYIVEYYRVGWNMWLKAATCRQLTTTLGELIEGSEYKFRVKAENPYGVSDPSPESDVVFIPDPKRGLLEPPEHKPGETDVPMDVWLEDKKRQKSPSPIIDEQYGEKKTKKKRGPTAASQGQTEKHSMMSEDSLSPPATPENYPTIPKRRGKLERPEITGMETKEEVDVMRKLEERRKVEEFKKLEEMRNAEEKRKAEEMKKAEEIKRAEEIKKAAEKRKLEESKRDRKVVDVKRKKELQLPPQTPRVEHDTLHGSSELMLVLVPHSRATTEEREMSKRQMFESDLALQENDIAPPMSLSAPELGSGEPPEQPLLRSAYSSTELLHERSMARFYQDMAQEEAESSLRRRTSLQRRRSFERRSSTAKSISERSESLQDIISSVQNLAHKVEKEKPTPQSSVGVSKVPQPEMVHGILTIEKAETTVPRIHPGKKTFSKDSMDSMLSSEDIRGKTLVKQTSEESTGDMEYEDSSFDEDEEDEYDEEEEEPITDEVLDEELEEELEEEEEEDLSNYEKRSSLYTTSESEEESQFSYSLEEATYHPTAVNIKYDEDTMISAYEGRGPLILGSVPRAASSATFPKNTPFGDLSPQAGPSNGEAKLKPILKRSTDKNGSKTSEQMESNQISLNTNDQKSRSMASPEKRFEPNFSPVMPKPILKVREPSQERVVPITQRKGASVAQVEPELNLHSPSKNNLDELSDYESGTKKKQVRIEEPADSRRETTSKSFSEKKDDSEPKYGDNSSHRTDSIEDDVDASRVLISHYSDIVAEYSRTRKPVRTLYLDYEALKAAAEKEEANMTNVPEIKVNEPEPELQPWSQPKPEPQPRPQPKPELQPQPRPQPKPEPQLWPQPKPEPQLWAQPKPTPQPEVVFKEEERVKEEKPTVHFEAPVEDGAQRGRKPLERIQEIPSTPLKKRSSSPRKRQRSQSREVVERAVRETVEEKILHDRTEYRRTSSPVLPPRPLTPTQKKVHSYFDFMMDFSLFILACWLYLFKDERLSIPVLCLMIYRQAHEAFQRKMEALRNKIPRRILFWRKN